MQTSQHNTPSSITLLEQALATHLGYQEVILLANLQDAYTLILEDIAKHSAIFCSPLAPIALHEAIYTQKLKPQYLDLKLDGTLETRFVERMLTKETQTFILSHHQGIYSDTQGIQDFTKKHQLLFIEDASHTLYLPQKSGAALTIFSLESLLSITETEGAFIATDSALQAQLLRKKAQGGFEQRKLWNYDLISHQPNKKLSPLIAEHAYQAFLELESSHLQMQHIHQHYFEAFSHNKLITLPAQKTLLPQPRFPIFLTPALFCPKEDLYLTLLEAGVSIKVGNKPIYKTTAFLDEKVSLFGVEEVYKAQFLLPSHPNMSENDVKFVIKIVTSVLETFAYRGCSF